MDFATIHKLPYRAQRNLPAWQNPGRVSCDGGSGNLDRRYDIWDHHATFGQNAFSFHRPLCSIGTLGTIISPNPAWNHSPARQGRKGAEEQRTGVRGRKLLVSNATQSDTYHAEPGKQKSFKTAPGAQNVVSVGLLQSTPGPFCRLEPGLCQADDEDGRAIEIVECNLRLCIVCLNGEHLPVGNVGHRFYLHRQSQ